MKRFYRVSTALLATAVLSACGGGSGSEAGSTTSYAVGTAWANLYDGGARSWSLTGTTTFQATGGGSASYATTASLALTPLADAHFPANDVNAHVLQSSTTVSLAGSSGTSTSSWYLDANLLYMGSVDSDGYCEVASQPAPPAAYATIGSSGPLASYQLYDSCSAGATLVGTGTLSWSLELQNGQPFFCMNSQTGYVSSGSYTEKDCVAIDVNGTIGSQASITATDISTDGVGTLTLRTN